MKLMVLLGLVALLSRISYAELSENESTVMQESEMQSETTETPSSKEKRGTQSDDGVQYSYPLALTNSNSGSYSNSYSSSPSGSSGVQTSYLSGGGGSNYGGQSGGFLSGEVLSRGVNSVLPSMSQGAKSNLNVGSLLSGSNYLSGIDAGSLGSTLGGLNLHSGLLGNSLGSAATSLPNGLSGYGGGLYSLGAGLNFGQLSNGNLGSLGSAGGYDNSALGGSLSYDSLSSALKGGIGSVYGNAGLGYGNGGLSYGSGSFGIENSLGAAGANAGTGVNFASNYIPATGNIGGGLSPYSNGVSGDIGGLIAANFQGVASALQGGDLSTPNKIGPVTFGQGQGLQDASPNLQQQAPAQYNAPPSYAAGSRGLGHYASSGDFGSKPPQILYSQSHKQNSGYFGGQSNLGGATSSHGIFYKGPSTSGNYLPSSGLSIQGSLAGKFSGPISPNSYISSGSTRLQSSYSSPSANFGTYSPGFSRGNGFSGNYNGGFNGFSSALGSQYSSSQISPNYAIPTKLPFGSGSINGGYLPDSDSTNSYNTISYSVPTNAKGYSPN